MDFGGGEVVLRGFCRKAPARHPAGRRRRCGQAGAPICEVFDFGEWKSEVASRRNPDGSVSFRAVDAGIWGFGLEFVVDNGAKRTLQLREEQHEYTFTET